MALKHFSLIPPSYDLHSLPKSKQREWEQQRLALLVDVVISNTVAAGIPHDFLGRTGSNWDDKRLNASLKNLTAATQF